MLPDLVCLQTTLRLLLLAASVLLWRRIDVLANLSTTKTPRFLRLVIVTQYVSLCVLILWLVSQQALIWSLAVFLMLAVRELATQRRRPRPI